MVEHRLAKARVAGSNPVSRSNFGLFARLSSVVLFPNLGISHRGVVAACTPRQPQVDSDG